MEKRTIYNECYSCIERLEISSDCHIGCANPDRQMTGEQCGIDGGWFNYPHNFDPTWKTKMCKNWMTEI